MPRFAPAISIADLTARVTKAGGIDELLGTETISQDIGKIKFDLENYSCDPNDNPDEFSKSADPALGYHTLSNGFTFLGCAGWGDWEMPVYFIIYWDGKKLRGYVPEEGNTFNTKTRTAYGSEGETDKPFPEEELSKMEEEANDLLEKGTCYPVDWPLYTTAIMDRISIR